MNKAEPQQISQFATEQGAVAAGRGDSQLSARLKQATVSAHRGAESSGIIRQLIEQRASRDGYQVYLAGLHPVYAALESRLAPLRAAPGFDRIADPALARQAKIEQDLRSLCGPDWRRRVPRIRGAEAYARRILNASRAQLVAHAYVRYLGDLHGGQVIKRMLRKSLALDVTQLNFYDFPAIEDIVAARRRFRDALDYLGVRLDGDLVVDEALTAFALATRMSLEVETEVCAAAAAGRLAAPAN